MPAAARKSYLLRLDADLFAAIRRWADDDLRSVNQQMEFLLRDALHRAHRLPARRHPPPSEPGVDQEGG